MWKQGYAGASPYLINSLKASFDRRPPTIFNIFIYARSLQYNKNYFYYYNPIFPILKRRYCSENKIHAYICTINNVLFYNFFVKILSQQRFVSILYHTSLVCSYVSTSTYCYLLITRTIRIIIVIWWR